MYVLIFEKHYIKHRSIRSKIYLKGGLEENNINNEGVEITKEITKENKWIKFPQTRKNINPKIGHPMKHQVEKEH